MPGGVTAPALNSACSSDHRACGQRYLENQRQVNKQLLWCQTRKCGTKV